MAVDRYDFGGLLFNLVSAYNSALRDLSTKAGLYSGQPRILTVIKDNEGCTLSELSEMMSVGMPSLSVSIRNLRKSGLVRDEGGRGRSRGLYLTEEGMAKAMKFHELFDAFLIKFLEELGPERAENLEYELRFLRGFLCEYRDKKE